MVSKVSTMPEFESAINTQGLAVVDFYADWCGPCKAIAPFIEQMAQKYPGVRFLKVDVDAAKEIAQAKRISAMPTFHFYAKGQLVEEMKGANPSEFEKNILKHKGAGDPFSNSLGHKLSAGPVDPNVPALSAREARLLAFQNLEGPKKPVDEGKEGIEGTSSSSSGAIVDGDIDEEEALAKALALSMADVKSSVPVPPAASTSSASKATVVKNTGTKQAQEDAEFAAAMAEQDLIDAKSDAEAMVNNIVKSDSNESSGFDGVGEDEEMVPVPVNESLLQQLVEMGFPEARSRKSLVHGGSLDGALAWLTEHQDDADIDQPYMVRLSDTIPKAPLTEEEKEKQMQVIKDRVKSRREERQKTEKADSIRKEKERRERGQEMETMQEERARLQRKRDAERAKKEKNDAIKERERLKAEITRDKEIRRLNKGVIPSILGVDGYNPSIGDKTAAQDPSSAVSEDLTPSKRDATDEKKTAPSSSATKKTSSTGSASKEILNPEQKIETAITTILRYRTGGDGGTALKLLLTFVNNIVKSPNEPKYRAINTESNAFKTKLAHIVGPVLLLKAVGFEKNEEDGKLHYQPPMSAVAAPLLVDTAAKLTAAEAHFRQMNP